VRQPNDADLLTSLAKVYEANEWWGEAREIALRATREKPNMAEPQHILRRVEKQLKADPRLYLHAAERRQAAGDSPAMLRYSFAWAENSRQADDYVTVGEACEKASRFDLAENAFEQALKLKLDHSIAARGLARARLKQKPPLALNQSRYTEKQLKELYDWYVKTEDQPGGMQFLNRYREKAPTFVPTLILLADAHYQAREYDTATRWLREAIAKSSDVKGQADLYCKLGDLYLERGAKEDAKKCYDAALEINIQHSRARKQLEDLAQVPLPPQLMTTWYGFKAKGQYQPAIDYFQGLVNNNPNTPHVAHLHNIIGYAYQELHQPEKAAESHRLAAYLTWSAGDFKKLSWFCRRHNLIDRAVEAVQCWHKIAPDDPEAIKALAELREAPSEEARLQSRRGMPDWLYLQAMWDCAVREGKTQQIAEYFSILAQRLLDHRDVFGLLSRAHAKNGNIPAAISAYRCQAMLWGSAQGYFNLGNFAWDKPGYEMLADLAYQMALELNPFYYDAKNRKTMTVVARNVRLQLITGDKPCEDSARKVCDDPTDQKEADKLFNRFVQIKTWDAAERCYRLLQYYHPDSGVLVMHLAQIYLSAGKPDLAWLEIARVRAQNATAGITQENLKALATRAEQEMERRGQAHPALPVVTEPPIEVIARRIATDLAKEGMSRAALVESGLAKAAGDLDTANDSNIIFAVEAFKLALSSERDPLKREDVLAKLLARFLDAAAARLGRSPRAWSAQSYSQIQTLLIALRDFANADASRMPDRGAPDVRGLIRPQLAEFLGLIEQYLDAIRQPNTADELPSPAFYLAAMRARGSLFRKQTRDTLITLLEQWEGQSRKTPVETRAAKLTFRFDQTPTMLPRHLTEFNYQVHIHNQGNAPADCVRVSLKSTSKLKILDDTRFLFLLPSQSAEPIVFHLTNIPPGASSIALSLELKYFDPLEKKEVTVTPILRRYQVFLSYAREDQAQVKVIYQKLYDAGFKPWMDQMDILPGEDWELAIKNAIRRSDFFVACMSPNSVAKRGVLREELSAALALWKKKLPEDIYLIPIRLAECDVPDDLAQFHWVDFFQPDWWIRLETALRTGIARL
jgi:tetratricopeptide (TPR) repeat protein